MPKAKRKSKSSEPKLVGEPETVIMWPSQFKRCIETLRLSHRELATILGCTEPLPGLWAIGKRSVPPAVAAWLNACISTREQHPYPTPPKGWRRSRRAATKGVTGL